MSSLWTPYGEHRAEPEPGAGGPGAGTPASGGPRPGAGPPGTGAVWQPDTATGESDAPLDPEDEAALREAFIRLANTPVAAIVADHAARLHELAVLHLGLAAENPGSLAEARLAVDAMGALVEGLGARLEQAAAPLADALAQLRLAFVQVTAQVADAPGGTSPDAYGRDANGAPDVE